MFGQLKFILYTRAFLIYTHSIKIFLHFFVFFCLVLNFFVHLMYQNETITKNKTK